MKVYLAVSLTNAHNPALLRQVVDHIHSLGHRVLSEHVAAPSKEESTAVLMHHAGLDPAYLINMDSEAIALIIRNADFRWVEECDVFISSFFGGSDGRGAEFEHLRLLLQMSRPGNFFGRLWRNIQPVCRGILGIFDRNTISRLIWAADKQEQRYYQRVALDPSDTETILVSISNFLAEMEKKGAVYGQIHT